MSYQSFLLLSFIEGQLADLAGLGLRNPCVLKSIRYDYLPHLLILYALIQKRSSAVSLTIEIEYRHKFDCDFFISRLGSVR